MNKHRHFNPRRRQLMGAALGIGALGPLSSLSFAAGASGSANRFVFVVLRGGMDGLSAAPAIGDPEFVAARGALAQFGTAPLTLDPTFALHPNLAQLHAMYGRGELTVVHAVGLPYRERSHFDAQQVLESGGVRPYELTTGWLGRALAPSAARSLALNTAVPLVLRGPGVVDTWAPSALPDPSADFVARLERLYANDAALATALQRAKTLHFDAAMPADMNATDGPGMGNAVRAGSFTALAQRAAEFLAQPNGPQAAVLELGGFDSHANQANPNGALSNTLRQLDSGLAALREGLLASGNWPAWSSSLPRSSVARSRSTARSAPTMAPAARPSCSAARSRAGVSSPTGQAWPSASASKAATCASRPTCARCCAACLPTTCR